MTDLPADSITSDYESTNFPLEIKNVLKKIKPDKLFLKFHQQIVKSIYTQLVNQRGLLLAHGLGQGKTILAASIADYYHTTYPDKQIIILLTKSLEENFVEGIEKYLRGSAESRGTTITDEDISEVIESFKFISMNASNMFKQVLKSRKTSAQLTLEKKLGLISEEFNSLDNALIIVDEAHNLFNGIANGSKNAVAFYDLVMKSECKLLFLSGTPIINKPFELVPCFNMLKGEIYDDGHKHTLFSEDIDEFNNYFVDEKTNKIKNSDKFINRIYGLVSYYGDAYFPGVKPGFPKKLATIVERIPMSSGQFLKYDTARDLEREESSQNFKSKGGRFSSGNSASATYRVGSRQLSNYLIPEYALGPIRGKKARKKFIDKIRHEDLLNLEKFSPKMARLIKNIGNKLSLVYSEFVSGEGLGILQKILESRGYSNYEDVLSGEVYNIKIKKAKRYAVISGAIDIKTRKAIINAYNNVNNKSGEFVQILLLSATGAEGISTKRTRTQHTLEPYWNYGRIDQFEGRGIRYNSHSDLKKEDQTVQSYIYLSTYPKSYPKRKIKEPTTDEKLYMSAVNGKKIISSFYSALISASIDCTVWNNLSDTKCLICCPSNKKRYNININIDMKIPNPCQELKATKTKATVIYDDEKNKYYYRINNKNTFDINIYVFDKSLNGYKNMDQSHRAYPQLVEKISKMDA